MDFFSRMTESQTRRSAVNLNKIKPDVACSNQHALTRPVINDGFSTSSGEDLNNQSFLRLMATVEEKNLIALENQRLANELSLAQSQLTDSSSKLQMFQNVHDELATTKSQLEEKESLIFDMTEKNLFLTNENSRLRRKIDRDRLLESSRAIEKKLMLLNKERLVNHVNVLQTQLKSNSNLQMFQNLHIELAKTKSKLEKQNSLITDMTEKNLRLANDDSRLRRKVEDRDRIIASSAIEKNLIVLDKERLTNELSLLQSQLTDSSSKLQMFQNVHDELATTKIELENNKREMTNIEEKNLRLTNDDSRLRRKIEDRDKLIASSQAEVEALKNCLDEQKLSKVHDELAVAKPSSPIASSRAIENNPFVLDKERLENELSLLQSQLTDSSSKLQNVHDELATTKSELEEKERVMTEIIAENVHLTNENSVLMRKIEAKDRLIAYKRTKFEELHNCYEEKKLHKVHNELASSQRALVSKNRAIIKLQEQNQESRAELEKLRTCLSEQQLDTSQLAVATRELESKSRTITELEAKNLTLAENDSQLRQKMEETDRLLLSSKAEANELRASLTNQTDTIEQLLDQVKSLEKEKDEALQKLAEMENNQKGMKPKLTVGVGCGSNEEVFSQLQIEEPIIPPVSEITEILTPFLACNSTAVQAKSSVTEPQPLVTDAMENTPAQTFNEKKAVKQSTKQPQAALPEFSITTTIEKEVYVDRIVVTGIANKDCGRVVGRHGSNAKRIEEEYWVSVYFINGYLFITGGDAESRLAACSDIIDNLPVTIECPKINLRRNIFYEDYLLRELAFNHNVQIYRPCQENKYVTIWGTLANCKRVYAILQNGTR
ncbi:hypothetical protein DAPPUDRAFT_114611 [Daphnia pulex]|uniref:K Homology domain-containing protein n=1 Tax=Daphnia pulex TaxID=6669 RepID=E9HIR2_DAPPU|nr:hypothetical protein DAPPUDRAFT_114611 [Daphnia pulex]|eukprot:EFX68322.1 hypothetical protein DAPPUDRAFT_114611 [Daphnia pulex]